MSAVTRILRALALGLAVLASPALATDAPHDASSTPTVLCSGCHKLHASPGAGLTKQPNNFDLCQSCHGQKTGPYGFPWNASDQAQPGARGIHHHFEGPSANAAYGAQRANNPEVARRLSGDQLQCSACHDQHMALKEYGGKQQLAPVTRAGGTGSGTMAVTTVEAPDLADASKGAIARGYLVKLTSSTAFQISNDGGRSWFGWDGSYWVAGAPGSRTFSTGTPVALNDGEKVKVTFSGGPFVAGDAYRFYVSYSFLRTSNADDALCVDCHRPRFQNHLDVRGVAGGQLSQIVMGETVFSHPVGIALGTVQAADRVGAVLDADGSLQKGHGGAGDGNDSNDIRLDRLGRVWCYSCHRTHNADSNSLTVD